MHVTVDHQSYHHNLLTDSLVSLWPTVIVLHSGQIQHVSLHWLQVLASDSIACTACALLFSMSVGLWQLREEGICSSALQPAK